MVGSNFPKKVGIDMKLLMTKKNYQIFYCKEKDNYVVYNMRKEWKTDNGIYGHTHVNSLEQAKYIIDCVEKRKIPKRSNRYFLISLIRISKDKKYIERIQRILDGEEPKMNYHNTPKKFRK